LPFLVDYHHRRRNVADADSPAAALIEAIETPGEESPGVGARRAKRRPLFPLFLIGGGIATKMGRKEEEETLLLVSTALAACILALRRRRKQNRRSLT